MSPSERVGDYEILFELASGGMATILLARQVGDAGFERLVALKRVHRHLVQDPEVFAMASDEARLAALVRHSNVVGVTGVLDTGGELVLVQEYVEGAGLARVLRALAQRGERLPADVAARVLVDATKGLHATHEAKDLVGEPLGIVHRDVSPQNLLVGADGATRVIDFGIARAERRMAMTRTGVLKGKLSYMAPEQIEEREVDRRADVFAAGAVLFEALTGERAYGGADDASIMAKILMGAPDLAGVEAACPALVPVVRKALAKRAEDRFATAQELGRAVAAALPPADEETVAALVHRLFEPDLAAVRARIAATIGRLETEDLAPEREERDEEPERGAALGAADERGREDGGATPLALQSGEARRARGRGVFVLGAAAAVAAGAALLFTRGADPPTSKATAAGQSAEAAPQGSAGVPATAPVATGGASTTEDATGGAAVASADPASLATAPAPAGSATAAPTPSSRPKRQGQASATPTATAAELHPSPYKR